MGAQQLRDDATAGKLPLGKLIDVIEVQQKRIAELEAILFCLRSKNPTERLQQPYIEKAENKRRLRNGK